MLAQECLIQLLPGFQINNIKQGNERIILEGQAIQPSAACPRCQLSSSRVHSYYTRRPKDLPLCNLAVQLQLQVRRFRCFNPLCPQQTFAERFPHLLSRYARRTDRLADTLYHIGQALGGIAASRLAGRLRMAASTDTFLRLLRRTALPLHPAVRVLGVDDWAIRKRVSYGSILVDLERNQVIDILQERTADSLVKWLKCQPGLELVARDRSTEYARGITRGAPQATQVADRWHLLLNLSNMLEKWLNSIYRRLKQLPLPQTLLLRSPFPRTQSEKIATQATRVRRQERYAEIQRRRQAGQNILQISKALGLHRETVCNYYYAESCPERQQRPVAPSSLDPYLPDLQERYEQGCTNAALLWREIRDQGFPGTSRMVLQWMKPRRKQPAPTTPKKYRNLGTDRQSQGEPGRVKFPPIREIVWLFSKEKEKLAAEEDLLLHCLSQDPEANTVYGLAQQFATMVRQRNSAELDSWLAACASSDIRVVQHFAKGIVQDYQAVRAAMETPWSNGQTEGQVNRLKLLKRQMYGRAHLDLLRCRLLYVH